MSKPSLFDRIDLIMRELENSRVVKTAEDVEDNTGAESEHPTAEAAEEGTQEHETGEYYEEVGDEAEEAGVISEEDQIGSEEELGSMNENLPEGATYANEEEPVQPKTKQTDKTEHPARADKTAFVRWCKQASMSELLGACKTLVAELSDVAAAGEDLAVKMAAYQSAMQEDAITTMLAAVARGAVNAADMTYGSMLKLAEIVCESAEDEAADEEAAKAEEAARAEEAVEDVADQTGAETELTDEELAQLEQFIEQLVNTPVSEEEAQAIAEAVQQASGDAEAKEPAEAVLDQMAGAEAIPVPPEVVTATPAEIGEGTVAALDELGIPPEKLAATGPVGSGLSQLVADIKMYGLSPKGMPKKGSRQAVIRNYMKNYIHELFARSCA